MLWMCNVAHTGVQFNVPLRELHFLSCRTVKKWAYFFKLRQAAAEDSIWILGGNISPNIIMTARTLHSVRKQKIGCLSSSILASFLLHEERERKKNTLRSESPVVTVKVQKCLKTCPHEEIVQSIKYFLVSPGTWRSEYINGKNSAGPKIHTERESNETLTTSDHSVCAYSSELPKIYLTSMWIQRIRSDKSKQFKWTLRHNSPDSPHFFSRNIH